MDSLRLVRLIAFAIDAAIISFLWDALDNLIAAPAPDIVLLFGFPSVFCLYFIVIEGWGKRRASFGKRITGLAVLDRENRPAPLRSVMVRAFLLAALFFDWGAAVESTVPDAPRLVTTLAWAIPGGLLLFNLWLGLRKSEHLMLQDRLTATRVGHKSSIAAEGAMADFRRFPHPRVCARSWSSWFVHCRLEAYG